MLSFLAMLASSSQAAPSFQQPDAASFPNLFVWTDTCNTWVLREGDSALLINLGDGSVLDHLGELGIKQVEWVLFTDHHCEQCQGAPRLKGTGAKLAAPEAERALFEQPSNFRKMNVRLGDAYTIHGSSYVRPPIQPIPLDRTFKGMDTFSWRGHEFQCLDTRGHSPGAMSYVLQLNNRWLAFSGDAALAGAKMHTWFDAEWDYGFGAGIYALHNAAALLASFDPAWLFPSHGPAVRAPKKMLGEFQEKLRRLEALYLRGYGVSTFSAGYQDKVSKPTAVPFIWRVSPHLFKFKGPNFFPNFWLILADSGHALVVDCGLFDEKFLDQALDGMRAHLGLKQIDRIFITHMHGDHFLEAPHLREKWGAPIWAVDRMGTVCEHPGWFDYAAPIQAYGKKGVEGVRFDRLLKSGESFDWEGHKFTVDWMPGQTEFALCLHGMIDGRNAAFTGDNIFGDPDDPKQNGHEAVVAHNSAILEEGYIYGAEYLRRLKPDLLAGGHSFAMDHPAKFIERYRRWAYEMRDAFRALSSQEDYRYWFDPFWVRAEPWRVSVKPGESVEVQLHVRNFLRRKQTHRIEIHTPPGLSAAPAVLEGTLNPEGHDVFPIRLQADASANTGVRIVAFDLSRDGKRFGEWFDCVVNVTSQPAKSQ